MTDPADRFEELYRRHTEAIRAYVRRRTPAEAVDDVVSETFLVCWRRLDRVPADALPWLYAVARNTLANHRRRAARDAAAPREREATFDIELPTDPVLARAFASLAPDDRELLALVAWEGLSTAAAARALGCSTIACRVRLHRARQRLAARLAELEPSAPAVRPTPKGAER